LNSEKSTSDIEFEKTEKYGLTFRLGFPKLPALAMVNSFLSPSLTCSHWCHP